MRSIVKRALAISHSTIALQLIAGSIDLSTERAKSELTRFVAHAPADESLHVRYTATESLHGCIRTLRRGTNGVRKMSLRKGLSLAGDVLTFSYVQARTGFVVERTKQGRTRWVIDGLPPYDADLRDNARGPTVESALAVMVEASRFLRHRLTMGRADDVGWVEVVDATPTAESLAYVGIGGEDISDSALAVSFEYGECSWEPMASGIPRAVGSGFERRAR